MAKMKKGPAIKSMPVVKSKTGAAGGPQKGPSIKMAPKLKGGAGGGLGRLSKAKAYGAKKG